jgi:hypothetical protein
MVCYFYRIILDVCCEAKQWERLKYGVPSVVQSVYNKWDKLKFVYERVLTTVMHYNQIKEGKINLNIYMYYACVRACARACVLYHIISVCYTLYTENLRLKVTYTSYT